MLWHSSCWLFAFYLTEQCDIPPLTMSLVLGIALGCNAIIDAMTGYWLKRNVNAARIANRYQLLGASIAGGAFVAFAACSLAPTEWRFACALGSLTLFRCTYPLLDVAQNALAARIATSGAERRRVVAQRHVASGVAGICVAFGIAPILIAGGVDAPAKFLMAAAITAALAWIGAAIQPDLDAVPTTPIDGDEVIEAGSLDYRQALMLICVAGLAGTAFSKLLPYFLAFSSPSLHAASLLGWVAIGTCSSQFVWLAVRARYSENVLGLVACGLLAGASALLLGLRADPMALNVAGLLFGVGGGGVGFLCWAAMTQSAGRSQPYLKAGLFTACSKASQAAAIIGLGLCLSGSDYRRAFLDSSSLLSLLLALAPVGLALAVIIILFRFQPRTSRARISDAAPSGADCSGGNPATIRRGLGSGRSRRGGSLASGQRAASMMR